MSITTILEAALEARLRARVGAGELSSVYAAVEEAVREFVLLEPRPTAASAPSVRLLNSLDRERLS